MFTSGSFGDQKIASHSELFQSVLVWSRTAIIAGDFQSIYSPVQSDYGYPKWTSVVWTGKLNQFVTVSHQYVLI